ncbi:hypothetical protein HanIR_Chr14g0698051 [Helianthus annuus]|nr:hypothetical protein HanIR_Chr14g0698051 [Helianthus annuus]
MGCNEATSANTYDPDNKITLPSWDTAPHHGSVIGQGLVVSFLILPSATPAAKTKPSTRPHNKSKGSERIQASSSEVDRSIPFLNPATHFYTTWLRYRLKITLYLCKFQFYYFFS